MCVGVGRERERGGVGRERERGGGGVSEFTEVRAALV